MSTDGNEGVVLSLEHNGPELPIDAVHDFGNERMASRVDRESASVGPLRIGEMVVDLHERVQDRLAQIFHETYSPLTV